MANHQPDITRAEVEVFSTATNAWIIRTPNRAFPVLVFQGDSVSILFSAAEKLLSGLRATPGIDSELIAHARELRDILKQRLEHYEVTLHKHGLRLPYNR